MKRLTKLFSAAMALCFMCCLTTRANDDQGLANSITLQPTSVAPGSTARLAIELDNVTAFTGFEFDIMLPEGITAVSDNDGFCTVETSGRCDGHEITAKYQSSGAIKLLGFNTKNKNFIGNSGIICYLSIQAEQETALGNYTVATVNEVKFSEYVYGEAVNHTLEAATGTITVEKGIEIEDYQFYARAVTVEEGAKTATLPVSLNNSESVKNFSFDIVLPAGVSVNYSDELEYFNIVNVNRILNDVDGEYENGYTAGQTNVFHVSYSSARGKSIAAGNDVVFNIVLDITASASIYDIVFNNQVIDNEDSPSFTAKLTVKGDAPTATATMVIGAGNRCGTFCAPFEVAVPAGVTAYTGAVNGNVVELTSVGTSIAAGTPVIIESDEAVDKTFTGTVTAEGETCTCGNLVGTYSSQTIPQGCYALQRHGDTVAFYLVTSDGVTTRANGCYLTAGTSNKIRMFTFGDATAINGINALVGGNAAIYDAAGARQSRLQKGVNIVVGTDGEAHKVIVK